MILLVEDDPNDVLLMRRTFRKLGLEDDLRVLSDGEEAVAYLADGGHVPSLVILDLKLPRRSGLEVLAWMRARPAYRSLPVHILSSSEEKADIARAMTLGVASYRTKQVGMADLEDTVRKIVGVECLRP